MSYLRAKAVFAFAGLAALAIPAGAQSVISTHSGVIHFFEGAVFLNDQPLEARLGRYPTLLAGRWTFAPRKAGPRCCLLAGVFPASGPAERD